jgi:hypothetical protein
MASEEPTPDPTGTYDTLRRLERRLDEASRAAERLIAEAAAGAVGRAAGGSDPAVPGAGSGVGSDAGAASGSRSDPGRPPPAGWQTRAEPGGAGGTDADLELLGKVLQSVRELIPPELQRRLAEALREVLLALRALIDWYLERVERKRAEPVEVQDIPIV